MIEPKHKRTRPTALKTFVDRENFQEAFFQAINRKPEEKYKVLVYYGVGGIGKTALRKQLELKLKERLPKAISASLNLDTSHFRQQDAALASLHQSLKNQYKIQFPTYEIAYSLYWCKVHPDSAKNVEEIPFMQDGSIISEIISALGDMPVVGVAPKIAKVILKGHSTFKTWWTTSGEETLKKLEYMEPKEIEEQLPMFWASDISDYLKQNNKAAVFFVDTYEALWEINRTTGYYVERDAWVRELVLQLPLPENVLWVICGREHLRWNEVDPDWKNYMDQHLVGDLADSDAKYLLQMRGITNTELQEAIVQASAGVPFYLDLAIESYERISNIRQEPLPADFSGTHNDILERFLRYLDRSEKTALEVLSATRFWNRNIFDLLLTNFDTGFPREKFSELMSFSFINEEDSESDELKYTMHQLMRKNLQELQNKKDCHKKHKCLFEHYSKLLPAEGTIGITGDHKIALHEAFYHGQIFMEAADFGNWFYKASQAFTDQAQYVLLIPFCKEFLAFTEEVLGQNHPAVAGTKNLLIILYIALGKYDEAEPLCISALKKSEAVVGGNDPSVAVSVSNMAMLHMLQGKYGAAEHLIPSTLKISKEVLSQNQPVFAAYLMIVPALIYYEQGKLDKAEPLAISALKMTKDALGEDNRLVALSQNTLAMIYLEQNKYDEAERLAVSALEISKKLLGQNHPEFALSQYILTVTYKEQEKYDQAEPHAISALKIAKEVLGENHPFVIICLGMLADLYLDQGKYDEAERHLLHAMKISEEALGHLNPVIAVNLHQSMAILCITQGKYDEAERLLRDDLKTIKEVFGQNYHLIAQLLSLLARLYYDQGKYDESEHFLLRSLKVDKKYRGGNHPNVALSLAKLAQVYETQEKYDKAKRFLFSALKVSGKVQGGDSLDTAIRKNLSKLFHDETERAYDKVERQYISSLRIFKDAGMEENHPEVIKHLNKLAELYRVRGKYDQAEPLYIKALKISEEVLGQNHPDVVTCRNNLAGLYEAQGKKGN